MLMWSAPARLGLLLLSLATVVSCSTPDSKAVYERKVETTRSLEVPPDLALPESKDSLTIPSTMNIASYSSLSAGQKDKDAAVLSVLNADAKFMRYGDVHWLEIKAPVDALWTQLDEYFRSEGFEIEKSDKQAGFMQTNWLENRVNIPTNWFSRLLKRLYSSGLRDQYRIRLEKIDGSTSRVFIVHRGMKEESSGTGSEENIELGWVMRDRDQELEAEMMMRFLVYRGYDKRLAKAIVTAGDKKDRAILKEVSGSYYLEVNENFARSWRRTGLALDSIGLLVEDRNRSRGLYYLKVTEDYLQQTGKEDKGWFSSLFGSSEAKQPEKFILKITDLGDTTQVSVLDSSENVLTDKSSQQFLQLLQKYLR